MGRLTVDGLAQRIEDALGILQGAKTDAGTLAIYAEQRGDRQAARQLRRIEIEMNAASCYAGAGWSGLQLSKKEVVK